MSEIKREGAGASSRARISTGIFGLDEILDGGLLPGSVYIVQGTPGAGKTILANQLCFHRAAQGEQVLYVTLLAESHDRLLHHLQSMSFYDGGLIPSNMFYVSGFDDLETGGLQGILKLLNGEGRSRRASTIIVDGLFVLEESVQSEREFRKFINSLSNLANLMGSTILLLTNSRRGSTSPEFTMVDGWFEIGMSTTEYRSFRHFQVHKFRGSNFVLGRHMATISTAGLRVLPRLETVIARQPHNGAPQDKISSGVAGLDEMLQGGLPRCSTTVLLGPTGIGKTTLALQFISQCSADEPGLIFSFYETPQRLQRKAQSLGIDLEGMMRAGTVEVLWQSLTDNLLDDVGYKLLEIIRRRGIRRLVVDGTDGIEQSAVHPQRLAPFLAALTNAMRELGVTSIFTSEIPQLVGGEAEIAFGAMSAVAENMVLLRYVELDSALRRILSLVKARETDFDPSFREFSVGADGVRLRRLATPIEGLLTGHAHRQTPLNP